MCSCGCRVGVARDRGKQPEASSSRQIRGEETFMHSWKMVSVFNAFYKMFCVEYEVCHIAIA